jgi:predicted PurR-regulated permease PerM
MKKITTISIVLFIIVSLYILSPILTPFLIAMLLAYLGNPLVDHLQRWHLPRTLGVSIVFSLIIAALLLIIGFLVPLLEHQISNLLTILPAILNWIQNTFLKWLSTYLNFQPLEIKNLNNVLAEHWQHVGNLAAIAWRTVSQSGLTLLGWLANLFLIPLVTFYLLRDWHKLFSNIRTLLPRHSEALICQLAAECNEVLGAFFRGQLLVMLILMIIYSLGLSFIGLDLALLVGVIAGLFAIVPYLGFAIGILLASIASLIQFQDWLHLFYVWGLFGLITVLENAVLTPVLVGNRIGLHPVAVLFAILCGGQLFGFLGVLLALPVAAVIVVLLRHVRKQYLNSRVYLA